METGRRTFTGVLHRNHPSMMRLVYTFFLLLAFALQSFAVQTHIHVAPRYSSSLAGWVNGTASAPTAVRRDLPAVPRDGDVFHCPLCQAVLSGGDYLVPVAAYLFLPHVYFVRSSAPGTVVFADIRFSHAWHSRAPPGRY